MVKLYQKKIAQYHGDIIVFFIQQPQKGAPRCDNPEVQKILSAAFAAHDFTGKAGQALMFYPINHDKALPAKRCLLVGLGKGKIFRENMREAGGVAAKNILKTRSKTALLVTPDIVHLNTGETAECLTEGIILGAYHFDKYKTKIEDQDKRFLTDIFISSQHGNIALDGINKGKNAALAACKCRDMANEPGNIWTADSFAEYGSAIAKKYRFKSKILHKKDLQQFGMHGILAVNSGSTTPPTITILEHITGNKVPKLLLVGKGLTFDAGGISIKPSEGMHEMKYDMCGGAAILAFMEALGEEKPKNIDVISIVPATDNLIGPAALKPGDIITMFNGKTVEVVNTDAEGRLILADAIAYGIREYKPDMIIDLATLTGAVIIGLGHHKTGLLSNNDRLAKKIITAGERSGEPLWRLPLGKEYTNQLRSDIADLKNFGGRQGGTITAAAFLQEFAGKIRWAHLDIAGTAWNFTEKSYIPKGPSGIGVRTLLEFVRNWK